MHKLISLLLVCFCVLGLTAISNHSAEPTHEITALKLKKSLVDYFEEGHSIEGMEVKDGILRPSNGYEIVSYQEMDAYLVKPITAEQIPNIKSGNFDIYEIGGSILVVCACGLGAGDDCKFYEVPKGTDTHVHCGGRCNCSSFDVILKSFVIEFQTIDGKWHI